MRAWGERLSSLSCLPSAHLLPRGASVTQRTCLAQGPACPVSSSSRFVLFFLGFPFVQSSLLGNGEGAVGSEGDRYVVATSPFTS